MGRTTEQPNLDALSRAVDRCMIADRPRAAGKLRTARRRQSRGQPCDRAAEQARRLIEESAERAALRRAGLPAVNYPQSLPVARHRRRILDAVAEHQVVVVCGATGSGKTTQLPKMCLELGLGVFGTIGHTQPRRLAARAVADRLAEELAVPLGKQVGYKVRFNDQTDPRTLVKVMTDGVLLAEMAHDRMLRRYDTLILDEAHERSLNIDFLLGVLHALARQRDDLKIIITSATIDPQRFADHFGGAPIIDVEGRSHPVELRYRDPAEASASTGDGDPVEPGAFDINEAIRDALVELGEADRGDVLVFLPGERDIREAAEALSADRGVDADVLPLYARLPSAQQQRIFHPTGGRRRVILATNVAETSLTVPGIRHVIDTGLARISRYSARSKVQRLPIEPISQASAAQRKGRCGRVAPGVCIRLYSEADFEKRPAFTEPEIQRTNLAGVILQMAALKLGDPEQFPFMDPPSGRMLRDGYQTLWELGALDAEGELTDVGWKLSRMPVDPRLGRMILAGHDEGCLRELVALAAVLSIQDPRQRPFEQRDAADAAHERFADEGSDFAALLKLWEFWRERRRRLSGGQLRKLCARNFLSYQRMREWEDLARQLREAAAEHRFHLNDKPAEPEAVHRALLTGLLRNIGRRDGEYEYEGPNGRRFAIFPGSSMFKVRPKWLMAAELIETTKLYAHNVAPIQPQWLEGIASHLLTHTFSDPRWDPEGARVVADERVSLFGMPIVPRRTAHFGPIDPPAARELFIHHALVEGDYETDAAFFAHNRRLVEEIEALEAKRRRSDLLVDPRVRFEFYDARVPAEVYSGAAFEAWRKRAEREDPNLLYMTREMLLTDEAAVEEAARYPDKVEVGGAALDLQYVADPLDEADGVTVRVPIEKLAEMDEAELDWMVPGVMREKVLALFRSLPKAKRKQFVPLPQFVERLVPYLDEHRGKPLAQALSDCVAQFTRVEVGPEEWAVDRLPSHLRLRIEAVDEGGRVVGRQRDLAALREQVGQRVEKAIARQSAASGWGRDGLTAWDFGALPESVTLDGGPASPATKRYPALIDQGEAAGMRLFESADKAAMHTRRGVRRLLVLQLAQELAFLEYELGGFDRLGLLYVPIGDRRVIARDAMDAAVDEAMLEGRPPPRDAEAFERRITETSVDVADAARRIVGIASATLEDHGEVRAAIERAPAGWGGAAADLASQLDALLAPGFLAETPAYWLRRLPRYLKAARRRIDKLRDGQVKRDAEMTARVEPYWSACRRRGAEGFDELDPEARRLRWMIEEYRVSLFAQDLGTAAKVSPKRLEEQARKAGVRL